MNWLVIVVLAVLVLSVINGYHKGFLRMVYSLVSWIIILVFVTWASPFVNDFLTNHTGLYETIENRCEEYLRQSSQGNTMEAQQALAGEKNSQLAELGVNLPENVMEKIMEQTAGAADEFMESNGIYQQIAAALASFVMDGISFFIALIAAWILVHVISELLGIVSKLPVLSSMNHSLGVLAGGLYGLMIIWIAFYVIALCGTSQAGSTLISYIYESRFLTFLYENNVVLTIILYFL